jgi:hypothetical protein
MGTARGDRLLARGEAGDAKADEEDTGHDQTEPASTAGR